VVVKLSVVEVGRGSIAIIVWCSGRCANLEEGCLVYKV